MSKKRNLLGILSLSTSSLIGCESTERIEKGPFYERALVVTYFSPEQTISTEGMMPAPHGWGMMSYTTRGITPEACGINLICEKHGKHTMPDEKLYFEWEKKGRTLVDVEFMEVYLQKKKNDKVVSETLEGYRIVEFK